MFNNNKINYRSCFLIPFSLLVLMSCEENIREVELFEKGQINATASSLEINVNESVFYEDSSFKKITQTWVFSGGNPSDSFSSESEVVYSKSGVYTTILQVGYIDNQVETKEFEIKVNPDPLESQTAFGGVDNVTEIQIQSEDFDNGFEGVSYHDLDSENQGESNYRFGHGVDIEETNDEDGDLDVSFINDGEWLEYTFFVDNSSVYDVNFRLSTEKSGGTIKVQEVNGETITDLGETSELVNTDNEYTTITANNISLDAGQHTLRILYAGNDSVKSNYFEVINTVYVAPTIKLGVYTESSVDSNASIQLQINNQFEINTVTDNTFEGNNALSFTIDGSQSWAMASFVADTPVDISTYENYNVALRSTSNGNILIRLQGGGERGIITLDATAESYGFIRDGNWHLITIPITDFTDNNPDLDLTSVSELMVLRSTDEDVRNSNNYDFYVDNFFLSKQ